MENEFIIDFTDETLVEGKGKYEEIKKIMLKENVPAAKWMLESKVFISSEFGEAEILLHLYYNGDIYIMNFIPSVGNDGFNNPDIRYLSFWAQECGWKAPQPFFDLVRMNFDFWKHFWGAGIVDSDFLDKKLGKREELEAIDGDNINENNEENNI